MSAGSTKSSGHTGFNVDPFIKENILPGFSPIQNQTFSQLSEALRTGGVGAQIPIIQQSVSQSQSALSRGLQDVQGRQAAQGIAGTPFGNRELTGARLEGQQSIARIPTDYAQQQTQQAPQLVQGILAAMLGALAASGKQKSTTLDF